MTEIQVFNFFINGLLNPENNELVEREVNNGTEFPVESKELCCVLGCNNQPTIRNFSSLKGKWDVKPEYKRREICVHCYNLDLKQNPRKRKRKRVEELDKPYEPVFVKPGEIKFIRNGQKRRKLSPMKKTKPCKQIFWGRRNKEGNAYKNKTWKPFVKILGRRRRRKKKSPSYDPDTLFGVRVPRHEPSTTTRKRSTDEKALIRRIESDLKFRLCHHHFLFNPMEILLDMIISSGTVPEIRFPSIILDQPTIQDLRNATLEFHIYCLKFRGDEVKEAKIFLSQNFSSVFEEVVVNGTSTRSFTPPFRSFKNPNNPFIVDPTFLKKTNNILTLKVRESEKSFFREKLVVYLSVVKKQKKFPSEILQLLEEKTNLNQKILSTRKVEEESLKDIATVTSVMDPLSLERIQIPVKSISCLHHESFDLKSCLDCAIDSKISESTKFQCPHCRKEFSPYEICLDERMMKFLNSLPTNEDIEMIRIMSDRVIVPIYEDRSEGKKIFIN